MDIRSILQLIAIRDHGSFAKAAEALGMSQPSLSVAVGRLEDQLKLKLFERSASGSELTPVGEFITERGAKMVAEADGIINDARLLVGGEAGVLKIGVATTLEEIFLPRFITKLARAYPKLQIQTHVMDGTRLVAELLNRRLDVLVCLMADRALDERFSVTPILTANVVAVASPAHPLTSAGPVTLSQLSEHAGGGSMAPLFRNENVLGAEKNPGRLSQYVANHYCALLPLALEGLCFILAPYHVVAPYIDAGKLNRIDVDLDLKVTFAVVTTRAAQNAPVIREVTRLSLDICSALKQEHMLYVRLAHGGQGDFAGDSSD